MLTDGRPSQTCVPLTAFEYQHSRPTKSRRGLELALWVRNSLAVALACWSAEGLVFHGPFPIDRTWNPLVGLTLGSLLVGGLRLVPGVLAGFWGAGFAAGSPDLFGLLPAIFATLQAVIGVVLVRQFCSQPLTLVRFPDIARFLLISGPVVASLLAVARYATQLDRGAAWLQTWAGDALGGLLLAPVVLALFAQPRDVWGPRVRRVAGPLLLVAVLMMGLAIGGSLLLAVLLAALLLSLTGQTTLVRTEVERTAAELSALHGERAAVEQALHEARREAVLGRLAGGVAH